MLKLIVWDLDGTLVDSLPPTLDALNDAIEPVLGRRLTGAEIVAHFGGPEQRIIETLVGSEKAQECFQRYVAATERRLLEVQPFEGVLETLDGLAADGWRLALFTGRGRRTTELLLAHLALRPRFEHIVTGDDVASPKPHPEGLLKTCAATGVSPSDAIIIGDSHADMLAGHAAGARTIACLWDQALAPIGGPARLEAAKPHHTIRHPRELRALLTER